MRQASFLIVLALSSAACSPGPEPQARAEAPAAARASAGNRGQAIATGTAAGNAFAQNLSEPGGGSLSFAYAWPAAVTKEPALATLFEQQRSTDLADHKRAWEQAIADCPKDAVTCRNHSLAIAWKVVADVPRYLSLAGDIDTYTGGAHGMQGRVAHVWDREAQTLLETADLFTSAGALQSALGERLCAGLDAARRKKGVAPPTAESVFPRCPGLDETTVLLGSSNGRTFNRLTIYYGPYVAGSYAEGAYEVDLAVDAAVLRAVKPEYRAAFTTA